MREGADNQAIDEQVELIAAEMRHGSTNTPSTIAFALSDSSSCVLPELQGRTKAGTETVSGDMPIELRCFPDEKSLLVAFERFVREEADPDVLLTYDARGLGLVADRFSALHGATKGAKAAAAKAKAREKDKDKTKAKGSATPVPSPFNLGRELRGATTVQGVETYSKAWVAKGGRQQAVENLETHEVVGCTGRFSLDVLRALVIHQTHKLTSYSFAQVLDDPSHAWHSTRIAHRAPLQSVLHRQYHILLVPPLRRSKQS